MTRFPSTRLPRRLSFGALYGVRDGESKNETVHRENANHRHSYDARRHDASVVEALIWRRALKFGLKTNPPRGEGRRGEEEADDYEDASCEKP
jgi:hypothetical protein